MNAEAIREELEAAHRHDEISRQHKTQAALLVHRAVAEMGSRDRVAQAIGTDVRKVELLLNMAPLRRPL